jgi:phosphocarrier protein
LEVPNPWEAAGICNTVENKVGEETRNSGINTVEKTVTLKNKHGLHTRPASRLFEVARMFKCDIVLSKDGFDVSAKSTMGILMLAAECGDSIKVTAIGADAVDAVAAIADLVEKKFQTLVNGKILDDDQISGV